jgi:phage virion morphogenesis protein
MPGAAIEVRIHDAELQGFFQQLASRMANTTPVMAEIGGIMVESTQRNFELGKSPAGAPWASLKKSTLAGRRGTSAQILVDTGALIGSIHSVPGQNRVAWGTGKIPYAPVHQFGYTFKPMIIRPRHAQALFWPGAKHPVKKVNRPAVHVPARPFLGAPQPRDWAEIKATLARWIATGR